MFRKYPELFQDPSIDYPIDNLDLNFIKYITKSQKILGDFYKILPEGELRLKANSPFELRPPNPIFSEKNPSKIKYGALLIHGLLDTPFIMKDTGIFLQSQGMLVRSILLPGHGTVPGGLLHVKYEDWLQAVRYGIATLAKEVDEIFLVGFSTGASLSVYHSLLDPSQLAGLILLSPAFKINIPFDFACSWHPAFSWINPRSKWIYINEENDYTKYHSLPFNAVHQVYRLTRAIKKNNHNIQPPCPVFIALSKDDRIVSSKATLNYFRHYTHPNNRVIYYTNKKISFTDERILVRSSAYPDLSIINFCHISIPISPDNPHYGKNGDYPLASRIDENDQMVYCALDHAQRIYYNLLYKLKLIPYQFQRLTFNPDFEFLTKSMSDFINSAKKF